MLFELRWNQHSVAVLRRRSMLEYRLLRAGAQESEFLGVASGYRQLFAKIAFSHRLLELGAGGVDKYGRKVTGFLDAPLSGGRMAAKPLRATIKRAQMQVVNQLKVSRPERKETG